MLIYGKFLRNTKYYYYYYYIRHQGAGFSSNFLLMLLMLISFPWYCQRVYNGGLP